MHSTAQQGVRMTAWSPNERGGQHRHEQAVAAHAHATWAETNTWAEMPHGQRRQMGRDAKSADAKSAGTPHGLRRHMGRDARSSSLHTWVERHAWTAAPAGKPSAIPQQGPQPRGRRGTGVRVC
eukprot:357708-Chlamydomonas_euryale.AAC.2